MITQTETSVVTTRLSITPNRTALIALGILLMTWCVLMIYIPAAMILFHRAESNAGTVQTIFQNVPIPGIILGFVIPWVVFHVFPAQAMTEFTSNGVFRRTALGTIEFQWSDVTRAVYLGSGKARKIDLYTDSQKIRVHLFAYREPFEEVAKTIESQLKVPLTRG